MTLDLHHHVTPSPTTPDAPHEDEGNAATPTVDSTLATSAPATTTLWSRVRAAAATPTFGVTLPMVLLALGWFLVRNVDAHNARSLGLIEILPISFFLTTGALSTSFLLQLRRSTTPASVLAAHVVALIFLLHGTVSWIEQSPRFPVAYVHVGFVEIIQRTGSATTWLDARMSWPGFFATAAMLNEVAGVDTAYGFLLWAPLLANLVFAPLLYSLARVTGDDRRIHWLTLWAFYSLSWVGQDYFAPQTVNYVLFLAFMVVLLRWFRTDNGSFIGPLSRLQALISLIVRKVLRVPQLSPGGSSTIAVMPNQRALLVGTMLLLYFASVLSHQLTPFSIFLNVVILVIIGRTQLRGLPLVLLVLVFGYVSYGAIGYWQGHLNQIFGGFGQVSGTVEQNVGNKVQVHSNHVFVIYGRIAFAAMTWAVAGFGVIRRLRKGHTDVTLLVGLLSPFLVLGGQSYGGEAILRVFLFSLPFSAMFWSLALLPDRSVVLSRAKVVLAAVVAIAIVPVFVLARYGNEQYEYVAKGEYVAAKRLYEVAPEGSILVAVDSNTPWKIKHVDQYDYLPALDDFQLDNVDLIYGEMTSKPKHQSYLYVSRSQVENIALRTGRPHDWDDELMLRLVASGKFRIIYENQDARIYTLTGKP